MQDSLARSERRTILLIGMHRSGTSALSQVIHAMGAYVGRSDELLPADALNPHGYWERVELIDAHENFLRRNGYDWQSIAGYEIARTPAASHQQLRGRLAGVLDAIDSGGADLLIKDPRLCLLLPVWQQLVADPVYVVAVRDPRKIAVSLKAAFPGLFTTHFLLALWQKYMQNALYALRGQRVLFVSYAAFQAQPEMQSARLHQGLGELGACALQALSVEALTRVFDRGLDRSTTGIEVALSPSQLSLQHYLLQHCERPGPTVVEQLPALDQPDAILLELQRVREYCMRSGQAAGARKAGTNPGG